MQFTHEASVTVAGRCEEVWPDFRDIHRLPHVLTHLRATAAGNDTDLARLVIALDGRHLEFAAQQTMCEPDTLCWQSLGHNFLYVLTVCVTPCHTADTEVKITVAYDPPGFLPDIAESLGLSRSFRSALQSDLDRYAQSFTTQNTSGQLAFTD